MTGDNSKVIMLGGGGQVPDSHIFPPQMLVMLGFYYAGKEDGGIL